MKSSLAKVALFVLVILGGFVYISEVLTTMSGGGGVSAPGADGEVTPEAGEALFLGKAKCYTCHAVGEKGSAIRGPNLGEPVGRTPVGRTPGSLGTPIGQRAEERARQRAAATGADFSATDYLLESLIDPNAYVVEGFKPEMPVIIRPPIALAAAEVQAVVTYLQSLGGEVASAPIEQSPFWQKVAAGAAEAAAGEPFEPYLEGDPAKGREIFFGKTAECTKCHLVHGEGGQVGPDLSSIAATRSVKYLVESVLDPAAVIASGFEQTALALADWSEISGVVRSETDDELVLADSTGALHTISKDEIDDRSLQPGSPMPYNFAELVTVSEFHDLLAYLLTLTGEEAAAADASGSD